MDRTSFEDGELRSVNGISPINVSDCYGKILELVALYYPFILHAGRESNCVMYISGTICSFNVGSIN